MYRYFQTLRGLRFDVFLVEQGLRFRADFLFFLGERDLFIDFLDLKKILISSFF